MALSYLNSCHVKISFTIENEKDSRMSFVDVKAISEQFKNLTSVYCKISFSIFFFFAVINYIIHLKDNHQVPKIVNIPRNKINHKKIRTEIYK